MAPLLNSALGERKNILQPLPLKSGYGLAYRSIQQEADKTLDGFFDLSRAKTIEQAFDATREIRAMPLNIVFADEKHIGWQVTGRYPNRKEGRGLLPSPGWDGRYDWDGYADPILHPPTRTRSKGWLGTANHRTVQPATAPSCPTPGTTRSAPSASPSSPVPARATTPRA
ncbi:QuiP [Pseudomonas aeruginosa]|nr:QuiP [Pseudomonas aeruginosa]